MPTDSSTYHDSRAIVPCAIICSDHFVWIWMRVQWNFHHIQIKGVYGPLNQTFCIQKSRCSYLNSTNQMSSQCYIYYNIANIMKPRNLCYDFIIIQSDFILELITRFDKCPSWWWFNPWKEVIFTNMCFRFHSSQQSEHNISTNVFVWAISTNKHNEKILLRPGVFSAVKLPWIFPGAPLTFNGAPGNIQGNLGKYVGVSSIHSLSSAKVFVVRAVQQHSAELMSHLPSDSAEQNRKIILLAETLSASQAFCWSLLLKNMDHIKIGLSESTTPCRHLFVHVSALVMNNLGYLHAVDICVLI